MTAYGGGIPTLIIDYGHELKAHKSKGFAEVAGIEAWGAFPDNQADMIEKTDGLIEKRREIQEYLRERMRVIKEKAREQFDMLARLA